MIVLASFRAEHFNNNGDQGNLEILSFVLRQRGVDLRVSDKIEFESDFVLVGDASLAAQRHYHDDLMELVPVLTRRLEQGRPTLLVGSSYEFFCGRIPGMPILEKTPRASGFVKIDSSLSQPVIGYRNSDLKGGEIFISGAFTGTQLFGPVLAKNPELLGRISKGIGFETVIPEDISVLIQQVRDRTIF